MSAWDSTYTHCCPTSFWPQTLAGLHLALWFLLRDMTLKGACAAHAVWSGMSQAYSWGTGQLSPPRKGHVPRKSFYSRSAQTGLAGHRRCIRSEASAVNLTRLQGRPEEKEAVTLLLSSPRSVLNIMHAFFPCEMSCHHVTNTRMICQFLRHMSSHM